MFGLRKALASTLGRKFLMSLSGFALVAFIIVHLLGNLSLLRGDHGVKFNAYSDALGGFGPLLWTAEIILLLIGVVHIVTAIGLKIQNVSARPERYRFSPGTKGGPSYKNISSTSMVVTGLLIGAFIVFHIIQFKYGPAVPQGYVAQANGKEVRDMFRLVVEVFRNPLWVGVYVISLVLLGLHLRHGFWSAFQTTAIGYERHSSLIRKIGVTFAVIVPIAFIVIPLCIYFGKVAS